MSDLDIAERRVLQDGRFKISIQVGKSIFASYHAQQFGEDAVLRILTARRWQTMSRVWLDHLGFSQPTMSSIRRLSAEPYGRCW
jgi:general secretion pathway protein E